MPEINLIDFFTYYRGETHQKEAVQLLQSAMPDSLLKNKCSWVTKWRETPEPQPSTVPPQCLDIIAEFEGFRASPYLCPAGVATIGYGCTFYPDGQPVELTDAPITQPKAKEMLAALVEKDFWGVLKNTIPFWDEMNDNQRSAITSFGFNLGAHFYGSPGFTTISACLRDHAWDELPDALLLYRNPGSSFEAGLRRRREAEGKLWLA